METATLNHIGIDAEKCTGIAKSLNKLLADYSIFYQNVRGYHWNIKGDKFFELHVKFEELYDDLKLKIDEVAERIVTLGSTPNHNYSDYKEVSEIQESEVVSDGHAAVHEILSSLKTILISQRQLLIQTDETNDEGTNALMSDYITEQEKLVWMYSSFLNN